MGKTSETRSLEKALQTATSKQGVFGCFEVTIGWFGEERVDYMTYDTKGIWRFYEIKVSKADFRSKSHHTFCGHLNYFVMTPELYDQVKQEIPEHIGVYVESKYWPFMKSVKRAKRQELNVDEQVLKNSLIRSLSREVAKAVREKQEIKRLESVLQSKTEYVLELQERAHDYQVQVDKLQGERNRLRDDDTGIIQACQTHQV